MKKKEEKVKVILTIELTRKEFEAGIEIVAGREDNPIFQDLNWEDVGRNIIETDEWMKIIAEGINSYDSAIVEEEKQGG